MAALLYLPMQANASVILDFNTASQEEIADVLFGIVDDELAQAIVDYRTENGPFVEPEDLLKVPRMRMLIYNEIRPVKSGDTVIYEDMGKGMHSY